MKKNEEIKDDTLEKENEDIEKDSADTLENENEDTEQDSDDASDKDTSSNDDSESSNKGIYIVEAIIAIAAIGFIAYALIASGKKGNPSASDAVSADAALSTDVVTEIDNSIIYEDVPEIPGVDTLNTLTEEECIAMVEDGTMVKLTNDDGSYVYCNNFTDPAIYGSVAAVSDEEVNQRISDEILIYFPENLEADHDVAVNGDTVLIDFVGILDGVAFEGGTAEDYQLTLGSGAFIDGFEAGVVDMKVGDVKDLTLTFPDDYFSADLAGKEVVFTVTLKSILGEEVYPEEITDEIVQQCFEDITTAEECKAYFKDLIIQENVYNYLCQDFYVSSINPDIVNSYYMATMSYYDTMSTGYYGVSVEDLITQSGMTLDTFKADVLSTACDSARYITLYNAIAAVGDVSIKDEDIQELADQYGCTIDELYEYYGQQNSQDYILETKVMEYLSSVMANADDTEDLDSSVSDNEADDTVSADNAN